MTQSVFVFFHNGKSPSCLDANVLEKLNSLVKLLKFPVLLIAEDRSSIDIAGSYFICNGQPDLSAVIKQCIVNYESGTNLIFCNLGLLATSFSVEIFLEILKHPDANPVSFYSLCDSYREYDLCKICNEGDVEKIVGLSHLPIVLATVNYHEIVSANDVEGSTVLEILSKLLLRSLAHGYPVLSKSDTINVLGDIRDQCSLESSGVDLKFWLKTYLYAYYPGGWGQCRDLQAYKDAKYNFERDRDPVRLKHTADRGWSDDKCGALRYRKYSDYDEYMRHQIQKWDEILKIKGGFSGSVISGYRQIFYRRFKLLSNYLPYTAKILCAGARQGTEVEVLRDIGFTNAYGIDLNPGPNNEWVSVGDFMHIDCADGALDLLYTNAVDHAFDLEQFFKEHKRVVKPGGYLLYDVGTTVEQVGSFEAVSWDSSDELFNMISAKFSDFVMQCREESWRWVLCRNVCS